MSQKNKTNKTFKKLIKDKYYSKSKKMIMKLSWQIDLFTV